MSELLPITISSHQDLVSQFEKISGIANKLEAQFNFQAMTANWYGDEDNIIFIHLRIETLESFALAKQLYQQQSDVYDEFADDVFSLIEHKTPQLTCFITLTSAELALLISNSKLLTSLLHIKLHKTLNLIAAKHKLISI